MVFLQGDSLLYVPREETHMEPDGMDRTGRPDFLYKPGVVFRFHVGLGTRVYSTLRIF